MNNFMTNIYQNNKKIPQTEKSKGFMEVSSHLNISKPAVSTASQCKPVSSSAPYPTPSTPSTPLENNLHYSVPGMPSSSKTTSHSANTRHHHKTSLPSATSFLMNHAPGQMSSHNRKSSSGHTYSVDTIQLAKDRPSANCPRKSFDSKNVTSHELPQNKLIERKNSFKTATPDRDYITKIPKVCKIYLT